MTEHEPTIEDLEAMAQAFGLEFTPERFAAVLPEVRWLWARAARLRELPLDEPAAPSGP